MLCECGGQTRVIETRKAKDAIRRRRECLSCNGRFTTEEVFVKTRSRVPAEIKTDGKGVAKVKKILKKAAIARNKIEDSRYENDDYLIETYRDIWRKDAE